MPCLTPYRGDTSQMLLFKIASCLEASGEGVLSFNGRTGDVILTLADVAAVADDIYVNESGDTMTGSLAMPFGSAAVPALTFSGDTDTGIYHRTFDNSIGFTSAGARIIDVSTAGLNLVTGLAYRYNEVNVIRAQTALINFFFGPSGNLTMTGGLNISIGGGNTFSSNTTGASNVALGTSSLAANTTGNLNVAVGAMSLVLNTTGAQNVAIGQSSLPNHTTGFWNTAIGFATGAGITTGFGNTIIGANVTGLAAGLTNNIIIADGTGNQRITVDSAGVVTIPIALTLSTAAPLSMASGANTRAGNAVLVGGTVTVANTTVTANTIVLLTRKTSGGTIGTAITYTVIAATSFTITSDSVLDTSTFSYTLIENP